MSNYSQKYIKYKTKYLNLKYNLKGGNNEDCEIKDYENNELIFIGSYDNLLEKMIKMKNEKNNHLYILTILNQSNPFLLTNKFKGLFNYFTTIIGNILCDVNMIETFMYCKHLKTIIGKWNFINVENMKKMFYGCYNLSDISFIENTLNVANMKYAFYNCINLLNIPDNLKFINVFNLDYTFYNCSKLLYIPNNINFDNIQNTNYAFYNCINLTNIPNKLLEFNIFSQKDNKKEFEIKINQYISSNKIEVGTISGPQNDLLFNLKHLDNNNYYYENGSLTKYNSDINTYYILNSILYYFFHLLD